jgi:sirohydrochlorin cobaltochelatase
MPNSPANSADSPTGLLLVGHGTRDRRGQGETALLAREVAERLAPEPVELGYLELAEPALSQAVERLVTRGTRRIVVLPLLLFAAGHAKRDIPAAVEREVGLHPGITWVQTGHLGLQPALMRLAAKRYSQAVAHLAPRRAEETLLLVVGRGSGDVEAQAELRAFSVRRASESPVARAECCFLALAEPSLEAILPQIATAGFRRIVVQPHLLFHGELADRVTEQIRAAELHFPATEWIVAGHLGVDPLLVEALVARRRELA